MNNAQRATLFAGVVFFVLVVTIFWSINDTRGLATSAIELQVMQMEKSKECANTCDTLIEQGEMTCNWIECHERCQIGESCSKANS